MSNDYVSSNRFQAIAFNQQTSVTLQIIFTNLVGNLSSNYGYSAFFRRILKLITLATSYLNSDGSFSLSNDLLGNANANEVIP